MDAVKILVIDDEEVMREGCKKVLTREGYLVKCVENGKQGLKILEKEEFELCLIDLKMPGISGIEFLEASKKISLDMVNIVITGFPSIDSAIEAMKIGAYDYIPKPFTPEQLRQIVKRGVERSKLQEEAKRAKREQENFILTVYHELKAPLSIIFGYLDNLSKIESLVKVEETRKMLERAKLRTKELIQLVEDLLRVSKIKEGKLKQEIEKINIAEIIKKLMEFSRPEAEKKNIEIILDIAENLPQIFADKEDMQDLFSNLLNNALKYNKIGGKVNIRVRVEGEYFHITFSDTGFGISEENIPKIFEEFYRVRDENTREITGTGLGLSIVKNILESYGGKIEIRSKLGEGSEFKVLLPTKNRR